ncbi:MAG: fumarylacetoacetate hydrolase family protein [Paracoccaceae bacterium]
MSLYVVPAPAQPSLPVVGTSARFPVRRIFCVGRNYAEHSREMGHDPTREAPFFFCKPADALTLDGATLPFPTATHDLHFEGELVVALSRGGADIAEADAPGHVFGYAPGNDLTRRDLQSAAKAAGRPWDMAKGFDSSAVCGPVVPVSAVGHLEGQSLRTFVNGALRQETPLAAMIWPVAAIIAHLSRLVELQPGDLIYTGTPAGVGALSPGDRCRVAVTGLGEVSIALTGGSV